MRRITALAAAAVSLSLVAGASPAGARGVDDTLTAGERLRPGELLRSDNGRYALAMQHDGNLVVLNGRKAIWASQTHGAPAVATLQADGNLVVRARGGEVRFASGTHDADAPRLVMRNDGVAVVYDGRTALWDSRRDRWLLRAGQRLLPGQYKRSPNGRYRLQMQADGNLVLVDLTTRQALWSSQTHTLGGRLAQLQRDGNLVVYTDRGAVYASATVGHPNAVLNVQDDGNAVIHGAPGRAVWASRNDAVTLGTGQILRPGQHRTSLDGRYRLRMQPDGNLVLVQLPNTALWASGTHGNPGARAAMQPDGNLVVRAADDTPLWASGTPGNPGARLIVGNAGGAFLFGLDDALLWRAP